MELNTVKDAFDHVSKKQKLSSSKSQGMIEQIVLEIVQALSRVQSNDDVMTDHDLIIGELNSKLKEIAPLSQLESVQKELNVALTKYPKLIEKSFNPDISKAFRNIDFDMHTVNQIIASHFYREGQFDLADCFVNEANEMETEAAKSAFMEMYQILETIKSRNLELALNWATRNHEELKKMGSDIELKLHRLQFTKILQHSGKFEALKYAKKFLSPFDESHLIEFQKLICSILWAKRLDSSPYAGLLSPTHWDKLYEELIKHFCNLMGQSFKSPLSVTIGAGVQGLPTLLKLMNVMTGKKQEWHSMKQLPVPVELGKEFQFHSIFVCPVSRDQASEENPPMLMSCGHVLCKLSITKLSKNSTRPFKCPYCPSEVEINQCRQLYF